MVAPVYIIGTLVAVALVAGLLVRRRNYVRARDAYIESLMKKYKNK